MLTYQDTQENFGFDPTVKVDFDWDEDDAEEETQLDPCPWGSEPRDPDVTLPPWAWRLPEEEEDADVHAREWDLTPPPRTTTPGWARPRARRITPLWLL